MPAQKSMFPVVLGTGTYARTTMLTRFYPEWNAFDVEQEARSLTAKVIIEARDGRRITIGDGAQIEDAN